MRSEKVSGMCAKMEEAPPEEGQEEAVLGGSMRHTIKGGSIGYFQIDLEQGKPRHYTVSKSVELDLMPVVYRIFSEAWGVPIEALSVSLSPSDRAVEWDYHVSAPGREARVDLKVAWEAEDYGTLAPPTTAEMVVKLREGVAVLLLTRRRFFLVEPGEYHPPRKWPLRDLERIARLCAEHQQVEGWRPLERLREAYGQVRP